MITNINIICPGCEEGIRLRIGVGHEDQQRFYVPCPLCGSVLRGCLHTDQDAGELLGLEIEDQPAVMSGMIEPVFANVFTELPVDPAVGTMEVFGGSPFIMHGQLLGKRFHEWLADLGRFDQVVLNSWRDISRWWGFYVRRDWARFDHHAWAYWADEWPEQPTSMQRHDAIHKVLQVLLAPLFPGREYLGWKLALIGQAAPKNWDAAALLASRWAQGGTAAKAQSELFDILEQFVQQRWQWQPGLLLNLYEEVDREFDDNWRITRDDFRELRDLFVATFERSHHHLAVLMSFANALRAGDPDLFPDGQIRLRSKLSTARAVDREQVLALCHDWGPHINRVLDRQLRNAIGHGQARHDLRTGTIVTPKVRL